MYSHQFAEFIFGSYTLLLEAGSRVAAPVFFEQSTRLLKVRN